MSRTFHNGERRIRVRGIKKNPPDLRRMAHALIALAQAEAEAQAESGDKRKNRIEKNTKTPESSPKQLKELSHDPAAIRTTRMRREGPHHLARDRLAPGKSPPRSWHP